MKPQDHAMFPLFIEPYTLRTVCPYCGDAVWADNAACCGEVHSVKMYETEGGQDYFYEDHLAAKFSEWLARREDAEVMPKDPMTLGKNEE